MKRDEQEKFTGSEPAENLKELYGYSKESFNREYDRFKNLEAKAGQYLSVLTLLIGGAAFFLKWVVDTFVPPHGALDWTLFALAIAILISLLAGWIYTFSAMKVVPNITPVLNDNVLEFFELEKIDDIYRKISKQLKQDRIANRTEANKKSTALKKAYYSILISVICFVLFLSSFVIYNWRVKPTLEKKMPETNQDGGSSKPSDSGQQPTGSTPPPADRPFPTSESVENGAKPPEIREPQSRITFKT